MKANNGDNYQNKFTHNIHYNELATKVLKKMHIRKQNEFFFKMIDVIY